VTSSGSESSTERPPAAKVQAAARDAQSAAAADAAVSAEAADASAGRAQRAPGRPVQDEPGQVDRASRTDDDAGVEIVEELLIDEEYPVTGMGRPGPPMRRSNPFLFGFFAALGVLVAWGLWNALGRASSVLVLLIVSIFIAVGLNPVVEWLMRRGMRRGLAVGVVFLVAVLAFAGVGLAIVPVVTEQINNLIRNVPEWLDLLTRSRTLRELNNRYQFIDKAQDSIKDPALMQRAFGGILGVGKVIANALFSVFTVLTLTLYFLASLPTVKRAAYSLVPASRRPRVTVLGDEVLSRVGGYLGGQFAVAITAGFCTFVFLEIIGLGQYAVALGILILFTDFIPIVGGLIGTVIITLIGLTDSLWVGVACLIYGVVYQQIENYVIAPRVMKRAVDIPGAVTVIAALLGGTLLGVVGALLAIPTAAAVMLIIREVWVRKADVS
jgi:predicted PurR-regulated permease PerM